MQRFEMLSRTDIDSWGCSEVHELYQNIAKVGSGTYGEVHKAFVKKNPSQIVALKKIKDASETEGFPITALREIALLQQCDHPNVVKLFNVVTSKHKKHGKEGKGSTYLVFEYMDHELLGYIETCKLNPSQVKCILKQILEGLSYLHSKDIIHRDIKSANILVNNHGEVKIADFGLAKCVNPNFTGKLTQRVVTRWYRAPELLLGSKKYTNKIDMWALGCVFAELLIGRSQALFPAQKTPDQFEMICEKCGTPDDYDWPEHRNLPYFAKMAPKRIYNRVLSEYICRQKNDMDVFALDLLEKMLTFNPDTRISAAEALSHPYFQSYPYPCQSFELPRVDQDCHTFIINNKRKNNFKASEANKQNTQNAQFAKPKLATKNVNAVPVPVVLNNTQPTAMATAMPIGYQYNNFYNCNSMNQYNNIKNINVNLILPSTSSVMSQMPHQVSHQIPHQVPHQISQQMPQMSQLPQMAHQLPQMPQKVHMPNMSQLSQMTQLPQMSQMPQMSQLSQMSQLPQLSQMSQMNSNMNFQPAFMKPSNNTETFGNMYFNPSYFDPSFMLPNLIPMHNNIRIPTNMNSYPYITAVPQANNVYMGADNSYQYNPNQVMYNNNNNNNNNNQNNTTNNNNNNTTQNLVNSNDQYANVDKSYLNMQNMQEFYFKEAPQILQKRPATMSLDEFEPVPSKKRQMMNMGQPYN